MPGAVHGPAQAAAAAASSVRFTVSTPRSIIAAVGAAGGAAEEASGFGIGFVRRGCFARNAEGARALLDPSSVFFVNPGQEQRYDRPHSGGDDCTAFTLEAGLLASLWGGDPRPRPSRAGSGRGAGGPLFNRQKWPSF